MQSLLFAQKASIQGRVTDKTNNAPIADVNILVKDAAIIARTDAQGTFSLEVPSGGKYILIFTQDSYQPTETTVEAQKNSVTPIIIQMVKEISPIAADDFPTLTLEGDESSNEAADNDVSGFLRSSRDIFQNAVNFNLSTFRFSERGYGGEWAPTFINGVPMNNPETGWVSFGEVGGLNDVLRNRTSSIGLDINEQTFGDLGGAAIIDTRATRQRQGTRISYASSNRSYRNRIMATHNTGLMPGGWAVTVSGSRRWAQEGYQEGTFYDAYSYFVGIDKVSRNKAHALNLTVLGAPTKRGRASDTFQEMYDLAGSNYYNPMWGYQNGEKRNSSVVKANQPMAILRYDWNPKRGTHVMLTGWFQAGPAGVTRLDWASAANPLPDYNRNLPSIQPDSASQANWADLLRNNKNLRQINWDALYEANRNNQETIYNADGTTNSVSGKRSVYVLENQRQDTRETGINLTAQKTISPRLSVQGGVLYHAYLGKNWREVEDLLGGDYFVDYDRFAIGNFPDLPGAENNDIRVPNNTVRVGEKYGYDYDETVNRAQPWVQASYIGRRFDVFAGVQYTNTQMWRTGHMQNGKFPDNSIGDSEKLSFNTPSFKYGMVYKANGRNFIYANASAGQRAPNANDVYLSPRLSNNIVSDLQASSFRSVEGGYQLRAPYLRGRITGYLTDVINETDSRTYFAPSTGVFANAVLKGIDRRHTGVEIAIEYKPLAALTLTGASNMGKYYFTSRPTLTLSRDNTSNILINDATVYQKNFYVARTPQTVGSISAKYDFPNFMFATISANYSSGAYYNFDVIRRTADFVALFEPGTSIWNTVLDQQKAPQAVTLDLFASKSWRLRKDFLGKSSKFLALTVGVSNLLDNQNVIISGRDAYRNAIKDFEDIRLYGTELTYAFGINYFAGLTLRFQ